MLKSTCLAAFLVVASAAGAQTQAPASQIPDPNAAPGKAQAKPSTDKTDLEKIVCEKQETTGSRLGTKKVCLTVAQWLEFKKDEQDQLQHLQQNLGIASH